MIKKLLVVFLTCLFIWVMLNSISFSWFLIKPEGTIGILMGFRIVAYVVGMLIATIAGFFYALQEWNKEGFNFWYVILIPLASLVISTIQGSELDQIKTDLEDPEAFEKIKWKNHPCYYKNMTVDTGTQCEAYTIIKNGTPINFFIGYTESHAVPVTNIMDNIIF